MGRDRKKALTWLGNGRRREHGYLLLPHAGLANCIALGVVRDTRTVDLPFEDRFNYFPASPYVSLSICLSGQLYPVKDGKAAKKPFPKIMLSGPAQTPTSSYSPGPVHVLTVAFYPDIPGDLLGLKASDLTGDHLPIEACGNADLAEQMQALGALDDATIAFDGILNHIAPLWEAKRPRGGVTRGYFQDWVAVLTTRIVTSDTGRSLRQLQRRFKNLAGQSQRSLARVARVEKLFGQVIKASDKLRYAELAADSGYADQSHMGREVRRITGLPPGEIMRRIENEEAFWFYRLIGRYLP
jgi:AraC-like DNA-binding protein